MAASTIAHPAEQARPDDGLALAHDFDEGMAAPIRAGMRARAIAEACERLELATVMVDGSGRVLHVGALAAPLLDGEVRVAAGHLVGASGDVNRRVERALMAAIGTGASDDDADDDDDVPGQGTLCITGVAVRDPSPFQLLKGLVVFAAQSDSGGGLDARMSTLRALLPA